MDTQNRLGKDSATPPRKKKLTTLMLIVFILGVIVGIIGLCVAFKFIFYIGIGVIIIAVLALLWFLLSR